MIELEPQPDAACEELKPLKNVAKWWNWEWLDIGYDREESWEAPSIKHKPKKINGKWYWVESTKDG